MICVINIDKVVLSNTNSLPTDEDSWKKFITNTVICLNLRKKERIAKKFHLVQSSSIAAA